jgi:formate dehydrogenase maturation protein FdhE
MKLETLEKTRKKREKLEKKIEEKTGEKEGPVTRRIASSGLSEELKEEASLIDKLEGAEKALKKAQNIIDSLDTEKHERYLEKLSERGTYTGTEEYHSEEVEKSNKASKALENFLKELKGEEKEEIFPNLEEIQEADEDLLDRGEITSKLLEASKELSGAESILRTQDKPSISDQKHRELEELAGEIKKEKRKLLETAMNAEAYLKVAEKAVSELEK